MNKYTSLFSLGGVLMVLAVSIVLLGKENVNPNVYYKEPDSTTLRRAPVTYTPFLVPAALGFNLKGNLNKFLSFSISDPRGHVAKYSYFFHSDYKPSILSYSLNQISMLKNKNVRVVDFIITQDPIYIGSEIGFERNWAFYVEGYFSYQGLFSKKSGFTEKAHLFVRVKDDGSNTTNPLGVAISSISGLP